MTNRHWSGRLEIDGETAWWSGSVGDAVSHQHFAAQAVFSDVPVRLLNNVGTEVSATCILIEPGTRHQLLPDDFADICYVEPAALRGSPDDLRARIAQSEALIVSGGRMAPFWRQSLGRIVGRRIDPRISRGISAIERLPPHGTVRLADVCSESQLSIGRFRHLFSSEIGIPFQQYVLWCRLRGAFDELLAGSSITRFMRAT